MRNRLAVLVVPAVLAMLFLAAAPAVAADVDHGLYIGAGITNTSVEVDDPTFSLDDSDNGYKVILGWRIFNFLAVEANYVDFGTVEDSQGGTDVSASSDGTDLSALLILTLGKHVDIFAKGGYVSWDTEIDSNNVNVDSNNDGNDLLYGLGGAFRIGDSLQIRAEYERFEIENTDSFDLGSVSATFTF
jgi:OmpA-OmpF porin, OOP family